MNTYNKLLLDEIQATANFLAKHIDDTNLDIDNRKSINHHLEISLNRLDRAINIMKNSFK
jgi:hypothetical protein